VTTLPYARSYALNMGTARRYAPCKIFPLIRFEGAERVQQIFKAVDNLRELRPALHKAAQS
ncbi:MAG TPA: hypothetical protein VM910_17725, partial [Bradyrhizobium sp.]|nr:hypothetical protein [Bradyrhizobium sp.]